VDISVEKLQFFLETAWVNAPKDANTLRDQMFTYETTARNLARGGSIGSVSKNNASHSYRGPGLGTYTPDQLGDAWRMLINFYEDSLRWVKWAILNPPTPLPDWWPVAPPDGDYDPATYAAMKWKLKGCTEYQTDLSDLRLHPTLGNGSFVQTW